MNDVMNHIFPRKHSDKGHRHKRGPEFEMSFHKQIKISNNTHTHMYLAHIQARKRKRTLTYTYRRRRHANMRLYIFFSTASKLV